MSNDLDVRPEAVTRPSHGQLLAWSLWLTPLALYGVLLFSLSVTAIALVPFTLGIPLVFACLVPVRSLANYYRRWAGQLLGRQVPAPYRAEPQGNAVARIKAALADPATWRDLVFLIANGIVGVILTVLSFSLLLGGIFYLIYPLLWSVTPENVFGTPFGFFTIHTLGGTFALYPVAALSFALWAATDRALLGATARLAASVLGRRDPWIRVPASPA